jgi:hypothetical protein
MVLRGRRQGEWILGVRRAMQAALGQQLKTVYGLPTELTPELAAVLAAIDNPTKLGRCGVRSKNQLQASIAERAALRREPYWPGCFVCC